MSIIRLVTVNCDASEHSRKCEGWIGNEHTAAEARRLARLVGWVHVGTGRDALDYSPECWAAQAGVTQ